MSVTEMAINKARAWETPARLGKVVPIGVVLVCGGWSLLSDHPMMKPVLDVLSSTADTRHVAVPT
jgi:hypothetical protein